MRHSAAKDAPEHPDLKRKRTAGSDAAHEVDKRTIALGNPIKALGSHEITGRRSDEVSATVSLNVIPA